MTLKDADKIKEAIMDSDDFVGCSDDIKRVIDSVPEVVIDTDTISRQQAIDALWKALYSYEDKTEKQFEESKELDISDWIVHRVFVQNMSDIDRQTILNLPPAESQIIRCKDCKYREYYRESGYMCRLDTGDTYMTGRNAEDDDWFCADAEREEVTE